MFAKYYQDELAWLREMGAELATQRPEMARFLAEPGTDPDVERLLEGFAFMTSRIREKLDDEFPELTHGFMDMFCPHYLRPIPSMAIVQVQPKPNAKSMGNGVPRGAEIDSVPVDGTACRFRTVADLQLAPVTLEDVELSVGHPSKLSLHLKARTRGGLAALQGRPLRLHLSGDVQVTRALFVALGHHVATVRVHGTETSAAVTAEATIRPAGLDDSEAALDVPKGSFRGFRLLQEYFAFPERFMFLDIHFAEGQDIGGDVRLDFEFRELPDEMPPVSVNNIKLDCTPVINLFEHDADPIGAEAGRTEYRIRPSGKDARHYEVNSVTAVSGRMRGAAKQEQYRSFFGFEARDRTAGKFFQVHRRDSLHVAGTDVYLRLGAEDPETWSALDTISVELTCTNRDLPTRLRPGDIQQPAGETPGSYVYKNIGAPSPAISPPIGDEVHWRLLSHLSLNLRRLSDAESLRTALALYDFRARTDRQARRKLDNLLNAIATSRSERSTEIVDGVPIHGTTVEVEIDEKKAGGEGEAFLLGTILNEFLAQHVSLNSFSQLRIKCTDNNEVFSWTPRVGHRSIL